MALLEKEESESSYTRPFWPSKNTFILSLLGFSLRALNLWRLPYLWLHNGGCKSGNRGSWDHKGLARQRLIQASGCEVSGTCRGWRLGALSRIGASCVHTERGERGGGAGHLNTMVG